MKIADLLGFFRLHSMSAEQYARSVGVKFGKNCEIFTRSFGSEPYLIEIGDHVRILERVSFITHDGGVWMFRKEIPNFDVFGRIKVGSNTIIFNNALILPGVVIGNNCIIGPRSIVTKSIPDNSVVAGSPASYICSIEQYKERMLKLNAKTKLMKARDKKKAVLSLKDDNLIHKPFLSKK